VEGVGGGIGLSEVGFGLHDPHRERMPAAPRHEDLAQEAPGRQRGRLGEQRAKALPLSAARGFQGRGHGPQYRVPDEARSSWR
jgi:hypothetical protein